METFYESDYLTIKLDSNNKILYAYWASAKFMLDGEFRKEFKSYINYVEQLKPKSIFADTTKAEYVVPVETQDWINENLMPVYEKQRVEKVAIIVSTSVVAQISIEQAIEDSDIITQTQTQYFDDNTNALNWLLSKQETVV